jgi:protein gp37
MGKETGITWTDSTFNAWWGCVEVSPACDNCYARETALRFWPKENLWSVSGPRRFFGEKHWKQLIHWDAQAAHRGVPHKVFVNSMADLFEDRRDLDQWREKLFQIIDKTPFLIYQLLTKRADCIQRLVPVKWMENAWPANVWMGVTAENQRRWDERVPLLRKLNAKVKWVSAEPLLTDIVDGYHGIDWVVVGGESGVGARRMAPEWANNILVRCTSAGVKYFMKQKGAVLASELGCKEKSGKDPSEWPAWMRVQEFPEVA